MILIGQMVSADGQCLAGFHGTGTSNDTSIAGTPRLRRQLQMSKRTMADHARRAICG